MYVKKVVIKKLPKITTEICEKICLISDMSRLDFIRSVRLLRNGADFSFHINHDPRYIEKLLKSLKVEFDILEPTEEVKVELTYEEHRERLKQFPLLEQFLKRKGLIIKFCSQCDCDNWNSISNFSLWNKTEENTLFWQDAAQEYSKFLEKSSETKKKEESVMFPRLNQTIVPKVVTNSFISSL